MYLIRVTLKKYFGNLYKINIFLLKEMFFFYSFSTKL